MDESPKEPMPLGRSHYITNPAFVYILPKSVRRYTGDMTKEVPSKEIVAYNKAQSISNKVICEKLYAIIMTALPKAENKIWHRAPVWFIEGNPIVGYHVQKRGVQLLFWSGMSFKEKGLWPVGNVVKFKAAGAMYTDAKEIKVTEVKRWLAKSKKIQWDYKNIVKRRGVLVRLT